MIKRALITIASSILLAGILFWLVYLPPNGKNINRVPAASNLVAITFDDGPNPPYTEEILAILDEYAIKATFFMTGKYVDSHFVSAKKVYNAGHEIANHGWDERTLAFKSRDVIMASITKTDSILVHTFGPQFTPPPYFRAPQGRQFLAVADVLRSQNRIHIGATRLGNDWLPAYQADSSRIADKILNKVKGGDIIVLHDGDDHKDRANRRGTVEATRLVLEGLRERGLKAVSVGELLSAE